MAGIAPAGYTSTAPDAVVFNGLRVNGNLLNEQQPIGQWIHPYQGEVGAADYTPGNGTQAAGGAVWYKASLAVVPPLPPPLVVVPPTPIVNMPASPSIWVQLPQDGGCGYADQCGRRYLPQEYGPESYFALTTYLRDLLHGNEMTGDKAGPCNVARPYLPMVKNPEIMLEVVVAKWGPGPVETIGFLSALMACSVLTDLN